MGSTETAMADVANLNYLELKKWCVGQGLSQADADACSDKEGLFVLADNNGLSHLTAPSALAKLQATFNRVDTNGSGQIDDQELCEILKGFFKAAAVEMVVKQVKKLIDTYDKNQNGVLEFVEFVEMVHYGDFWGRFDLHIPVCLQEHVMTLAKGGVIEGGAPADTEAVVAAAEEKQAEAEKEAELAAEQMAKAEAEAAEAAEKAAAEAAEADAAAATAE